MTVVYLVLYDDAACFEYDFVFLHPLVALRTKSLIKYPKNLQPPIKALVSCLASAFELFEESAIKCVPCCDAVWLTNITFVGDDFFSWWDSRKEAIFFFKNPHIILSCRERTMNPHKLVVMDGNSKLIRQSCLVEFF